MFTIGQTVYRRAEGMWPPSSYYGPGAVSRRLQLLQVLGIDLDKVRCGYVDKNVLYESVIPAKDLVAVP